MFCYIKLVMNKVIEKNFTPPQGHPDEFKVINAMLESDKDTLALSHLSELSDLTGAAVGQLIANFIEWGVVERVSSGSRRNKKNRYLLTQATEEWLEGVDQESYVQQFFARSQMNYSFDITGLK